MTEQKKICKTCGTEKLVSEFGLDPRVKTGHRATCKKCKASISKINVNNKKKEIGAITEKYCPTCKSTKPATEFAINNGKPDGKYFECRSCYKNRVKEKIIHRDVIVADKKVCATCKVPKSILEFNTDNHTKDGKCCSCKECKKVVALKKLEDRKALHTPVSNKICFTCKIEKPVSEFGEDAGRPDGFNYECKLCSKIRRKKKKDYLSSYAVLPETKMCATCHTEKQASLFNKDRYSTDGLCFECRECVGIRNRRLKSTPEFKIKNKERVRLWNLKNPGANAKRANAYYHANKAEVQAKAIIKEKIRYYYDPYFNLVRRLRARVRGALKGHIKSAPTMQLVGCTREFFKSYFESNFSEGMTWELYMSGDIHIDHIIPLDSFDMNNPNEQQICFNWRNLWPMWEPDNIRKSNKLVHSYQAPLLWALSDLSIEERKAALTLSIFEETGLLINKAA